VGFLPPLGLAYLQAALDKEGHLSRIYDMDRGASLADVLAVHPDIIGIGSASFSFRRACSVAAALRTQTKAPLVLGDAHAWVARAAVLKDSSFDVALVGEGELRFPRLVGLLGEMEAKKIRSMDGLIYRDAGDIHETSDAEYISDLDALPYPSFRDLQKYRTLPGRARRRIRWEMER